MTRISDMTELTTLPATGAFVPVEKAGSTTNFRYNLGNVPTTDSLFTNAANLSVPVGFSVVATTGYSALDVGAAVYTYDAAVNATYVIANPRSSFIETGGRGFRLSLEQDITAEMLGATGDGVADDTAAILAARDVVGAGGTAQVSPGKIYKITSTIVLSANDDKLLGPGAGDIHDTGTTIVAPCRLLWGGASGGTMVRVKSAGTQYIAGNEFRGIFLDGNSGLAAIGLNLVGCRLGKFEVVGAHFTTALLKMEPDTALSEPQGCTENRIERLTGYQTNVGDGALLLEIGNDSWNCSQNLFEIISGDYRNSYAIDIQGSDSETFEVIKLYATQASAVGVRLKAGATVNQAARNNLFHYLAVSEATGAAVPVLAEGTADATSPSVENNILFLDTASNPTLPTVHTGATLWWATNKAPIGLRSYSPNTAGNSVRQEASGLIIQSGTSASIAATASTTITLPKAFPTGAISVSVTPKTAATTFFAACSATQLVINNAAGGATTDFFWRVEGY